MEYPKRGLYKHIVDDIGTNIISGKIKVGESAPTSEDICNTYQVSRTVTREAIKVLQNKGLVMPRPKTGIKVLPQSEWNLLDKDVLRWFYEATDTATFVRHLLEMRRIIEPIASALAAERATDEQIAAIEEAYHQLSAATDDLERYKAADRQFHSAIFEAADNPLLSYMARTINMDLDAGRELTALVLRSLVESLPVHERVLNAIKKRDAELAQSETLALVEQIGAFMEEALTQSAKN